MKSRQAHVAWNILSYLHRVRYITVEDIVKHLNSNYYFKLNNPVTEVIIRKTISRMNKVGIVDSKKGRGVRLKQPQVSYYDILGAFDIDISVDPNDTSPAAAIFKTQLVFIQGQFLWQPKDT